MTQRMSQGEQGPMGDMGRYLEGLSYPQNRQGIQRHLEQRNAPQEIRQIIQNLPDHQYTNMAEVMRAMNEGQQRMEGGRPQR
jgi:hypothetical protein